jgi:hypothetical protein
MRPEIWIGPDAEVRRLACETAFVSIGDPSDGDVPGRADEDLVLFGVIGLERRSGGHGGLGRVPLGPGGSRSRTVMTSESVPFSDREGNQVIITSHRTGADAHYEQIRSWAPTNTYLATPQGQETLAHSDRTELLPGPIHVDWTPETVLVEGEATVFEACVLDDGFWTAIGRVPEAIIVIDSHGVPLNVVRLERIERILVPDLPDLGESSDAIATSLDARFSRIPFGRVHGWADYWALRDIETDHIARLTRQHGLSTGQRQEVQRHWLARIERRLYTTMEQLRFRNMDAMHNSRLARHLKWNFAFQIWFNTFGPGARTWFGNRYTGIRHYTFRLRWRP